LSTIGLTTIGTPMRQFSITGLWCEGGLARPGESSMTKNMKHMNAMSRWGRRMTGVALAGFSVACCWPTAAQTGNARIQLTVNTDNPTHAISPYIYGHFFEHIYHSANGGLWGEQVWNRSFELSNAGMGDWSSANGEVIQSALGTDVKFVFGDRSWGDYELTLQALKERGAEGFLVLVRALDQDSFYWLNLGGWGNTRHAMEKEAKGERRGMGRGHNGNIQTGRWYDVRIRCEGNRIQCWLDGEQIIDLRDEDHPHRQGMIGLGTWGTHARYRNIQVKNLADAGELFSGLPTLPGKTFAVDFWKPFGPGLTERVTDALNNEYSVQLTSDGGPTGIEQANFRFIPQRYQGSIWMKGSLPAGAKLELLDQEEILGETILGPPSAGWAEYPFQIDSRGSTMDGSLRITLLGAGALKLDQVSLMGQDALAVGGFRPDLLDAVRGLRPPIIRWPGGCFASVYLWKDAVGPQHERRIYPAYMWEDQDINSLGTDEYMTLCDQVGAEPLLVINTGLLDAGCGAPAQFRLASHDDYLPYALDWMEYCNGDASTRMGALRAAHGHPEPYGVVYWELDNETWAAGVEAYIVKVLEFAPVLRAKAAELGAPVKIIACGGNRFDMAWNRALIDACAPLIDYVSIHNYEEPRTLLPGSSAMRAC